MVRCSIKLTLKTYWMTWKAVGARVMNRNDCKGSQSTEFNDLLRSLYASWVADSHLPTSSTPPDHDIYCNSIPMVLLEVELVYVLLRGRVSSGGWYCYSCVSPGVLNWIWLLLKLYWHTWSPLDTVLYIQLSYIYSPGTSVLLSCHSRSSITTAAGVTSHNRMKSEPPPPPHVCTTLLWQTTTT